MASSGATPGWPACSALGAPEALATARRPGSSPARAATDWSKCAAWARYGCAMRRAVGASTTSDSRQPRIASRTKRNFSTRNCSSTASTSTVRSPPQVRHFERCAATSWRQPRQMSLGSDAVMRRESCSAHARASTNRDPVTSEIRDHPRTSQCVSAYTPRRKRGSNCHPLEPPLQLHESAHRPTPDQRSMEVGGLSPHCHSRPPNRCRRHPAHTQTASQPPARRRASSRRAPTAQPRHHRSQTTLKDLQKHPNPVAFQSQKWYSDNQFRTRRNPLPNGLDR